MSRLWSVPTVQACAPLNRAVVFFGSSLTTNAKRRLPIADNDGLKKGTLTGMLSALKRISAFKPEKCTRRFWMR